MLDIILIITCSVLALVGTYGVGHTHGWKEGYSTATWIVQKEKPSEGPNSGNAGSIGYVHTDHDGKPTIAIEEYYP